MGFERCGKVFLKLASEWLKMWRVYMCIYTYIYVYIHTHTHTQWNTLTIKKKEILPFAATWVDLEIAILSEVRQRQIQISYITFVWNLKYDTNELIYKRETDSQT